MGLVETLENAQTWRDERIDQGVVYIEEDEKDPCCDIDNELDGEENVSVFGGEEKGIAAPWVVKEEHKGVVHFGTCGDDG